MEKKTKIILSLLVVLGYGLVQIIQSIDSTPREGKKYYLEDQTKMRIFGKKDLYANQNFTSSIDRLRTSSFADVKRKKAVKIEKTSDKKKKKAIKTLVKQKDKKKKKDKKKDKKKEGEKTTEEVAKTDENTDDKKLSDDESGLEEQNTPAPDYVATDNDKESDSYWLNLILNQPTQENFEAFYSAYTGGEIDTGLYYSIHNSLYENLSAVDYPKATDLLLRNKHTEAFILLFNYQEEKSSSFTAGEREDIQNNLVSYGEDIDGLRSMKQLFVKPEVDKVKILAARVLKEASEKDLSNSNSSSGALPIRGEESTEQRSGVESNVAKIEFYIDLFNYLASTDVQDELGAASSEVNSLLSFLAQNLNLNTTPGSRGSSRT